MDNLHDESAQPDKSGKTTCTFRIMPHEKLLLASKAKELGLSPSQYIEALVLGQHNELVKRLDEMKKQGNLPITENEEQLLFSILGKLKRRHKGSTTGEILLASLIHAYENHGVLWERSMRTFLKRVRNQYYKTQTIQP